MRRVFYNNINNNNSRRRRASSTSSSGWHIYKSLESFQHHIVFIFNFSTIATLWSASTYFDLLISNIFNTLTFWSATPSTTYSTLWPFKQQHLQHLDISIRSNIFNTLTFRSATSSAFWPFDQQQYLQHFDQQHL